MTKKTLFFVCQVTLSKNKKTSLNVWDLLIDFFLVFCQIKPYLLKKVDDPSLLTITTIVICIHSVRGCVHRQAAHILVKPCYRKNFTLYFIYTI